MKRIISCFLILTFMMSLTVQTYAAEKTVGTEEIIVVSDCAVFSYDGHGQFTKTNESVTTRATILNDDINDINAGETLIANSTSDNDIYKVNDDQYLMRTYNDTYLFAHKISVDTENFDSNESMFDIYQVSDEICEEVQDVIKAQNKLGNSDLEIEIYAPEILGGEIQPMEDSPLGDQYYYYEENGFKYQMKDYSVKYKNVSTEMIEKKGTSVLNYAKSFSNLVVSAAGIASKTFSVFGAFSSAYDLYKNVVGEVTTGSSSDKIYTSLIYDWIIKRTYMQDPVYKDYPNVGCASYKVWLNRHDTYQYYGKTAESYLLKQKINKVIYSENFQNPAPVARRYGISSTYVDGYLYTELYGNKIKLMGSGEEVTG